MGTGFTSGALCALVIVAECLSAPAVWAEADSRHGELVIRLQNGLNRVDLNGDGREDMVIGARWRGGMTGRHSDSYDFLIAGQTVGDGDPEWYGVTGGYFGASGKDECTQYDVRLVAQKAETSAGYVLVEARRGPGESYYDRGTVEFSYYRVVNVAPAGANPPAFRFALEKSFVTSATYCDVGEAFQGELGFE